MVVSALTNSVPWVYVAVLAVWASCMNAWAMPLYLYAQSATGSSFIAGPGIGLLIHLCFYHAAAAVHALMDAYPMAAWARYKVHWTDTHTYTDLLPTVVFNQTAVYGSAAAVVYWLTQGRGQQLAGTLTAPTAMQYIGQCIAHYALYETFFYWAHRALHLRALFPHHRLHHSTKASVGISGLYMSSLDLLLTQALPMLLAPAILGTHVFIIWMYTPIVALNSVHSHGSYAFPGMPETRDHSDHHRLFFVNYGTGPWDYIMGTNKQEQQQVQQEQHKGARA